MAHKQYRWLEERDERWHDIQIVHQGEVFPLLLLSRNGTNTRIDDNGLFGGIASRIRLQTGLFDILNISIACAPYVMQKGSVVSPFDRSKGYPLDQEDFSLQSRIKKNIRLKNELAENIEGLGLVVFASYDDLPLHSQLRLKPESNATYLSAEIVSLLERVFLTLTFPGGASFSARAMYTTGRLFLLFRTFFPTDTGPLPVPKTLPEEIHHLSVEEGFRLLLPFDLDQLQTIRARFLLLPDTSGG